jgi:hypothetical protein
MHARAPDGAYPLVPFARSASDALGHDRVPQPLLLDTRQHGDAAARRGGWRARRSGPWQGIDRATRRSQPTGFAYVAKRSAEKRADAGARNAPCARGSRRANVTRAGRAIGSGCGRGGQRLLPTPGH